MKERGGRVRESPPQRGQKHAVDDDSIMEC
jgi:hypothetical protein